MNDEVQRTVESARRRLETLLERGGSRSLSNGSVRQELGQILQDLQAAQQQLDAPSSQTFAAGTRTAPAGSAKLKGTPAPPLTLDAEKQSLYLLDHLPDGYVITDPGGVILALNYATTQLLRRARNHLVGKPLSEFVVESERKAFASARDKLGPANPSLEWELMLRRAYEPPFPAWVKVSCLRESRGELHWLIRDLSAAKAAEKASRRSEFLSYASQLLSASPDFATRVERVTRLAVPALADLCVIHVRSAQGQTLRIQVAHTDPDKERELAAIEAQCRQNVPPPSAANNGELPDRRKFAVRVTDDLLNDIALADEHLKVLRGLGLKSYMSLPLKTHGRAFGAIAFATAESGRVYDQDDLLLAEAFARRAALAIENALRYEEAQNALAERDRAQTLALHEIKIPLHVILNLSQVTRTLLQRAPTAMEGGAEPRAGDTSELVRRHLEDMGRASERLLNLVNDFTALMHLQNQTLKLHPAWSNLSELVISLVENLRLQQADGRYPRDVKIREHVHSPSILVRADQERLAQALTNLLDNAVKYSPRGGTVEVSLDVQESDDLPDTLYAHLVIRDNGIGVPQGEQELIFQPFVRASNTMGRNISGLGVGLAITQEIIALHGGRIWVESAGVDRGSAFHILLPQSEVVAE